MDTVPSIPFAPRFDSTRNDAGRAGKKVSTSRTGMEEATIIVASSGSREPSSAAIRGSFNSGPMAEAIAPAAARSAACQRSSHDRSRRLRTNEVSSAKTARGLAARIMPTEPSGSCHADSASKLTCSADEAASQARSGLDVGRSPTRTTRSGSTDAANDGDRSSAS